MRPSVLITAAICSLPAFAQPTLTFDELDLAGSTFDLYIVVDPGTIDLELEGAGADWDFISAQVDLFGAAVFLAAGGTPYAGDFPDADLAMALIYDINTAYSYYNVSSTALSLLASGMGSTEERVYSDASDLLVFPLSLGGQFNDDFTVNGTPNSVVRTCSGYGTVELITGIFDNVVKITSSNGERSWWKTDPVEPLVTVNSDGLILVWERITIGMDEYPGVRRMTIAPNPAHDFFRLPELRTAATFRVIDALGRVVTTGRVQGAQQAIDVSSLPPGLYSVMVSESRGTRVASLVKE